MDLILQCPRCDQEGAFTRYDRIRPEFWNYYECQTCAFLGALKVDCIGLGTFRVASW